MWTLYKKELSGFFSSLIGYLTIAVFLVLTGLMLWVLRSDFNILDYGYASLEGLFLIGPFLYLFLIPAITMRSIAEERRTGTIELLLTHSVSDWTIVWAKVLAAWTLVAISLLPTLVGYATVYYLGAPVGNIDTGAVVGSYIGLLLLGGAFAAIGVFCSSLASSQIVSFILAALLSVAAYLGFDSLANLGLGNGIDLFLRRLGMRYHYDSISRGVVDTRDVIYFLGIIMLFVMATRLSLQSRKWGKGKLGRRLQRSHWLEMGATVVAIAAVCTIGHYLFLRADLTSERRYTLSKATKQMLREIDEPVLFRVYLEGEFPSDFKRLQNETKEMLNQFRAYNNHIDYEFVDPTRFESREEQQVFYQKLASKGIQPTQVQTQSASGTSTQIIVPAADVYYRGRETSVQLIQNQRYVSDADLLNNSIQNLEYVLSSAIRGLARGEKRTIGFLQGHGELNGGVLYDIQRALQEHYSLDYVNIDGQIQSLTVHHRNETDTTQYDFFNLYDLLIVAKPTAAFGERDLYILDQYIMYGGKVLWLIDPLDADLDSLATRGSMMATRLPLDLDEMLFTYGVRLGSNLLMDMYCRPIPIQVGMVGDKPQFRFRPWYYFPEIRPISDHPIVRNLDLIKTDFVSSIDLIENDIRKTVLLTTSEYTRMKNAPALVDLAETQAEPDQRQFSHSQVPVAVLLEGEFRSAWRNRLSPEFVNQKSMGYREQSDFNKMIVISDGDIIRNRYMAEDGAVLPLGYDYYTQTQYANKDFILNAVNYLVGDEGMLASRSRNIRLRKLDVMKVHEGRTACQIINIGVPLLILAAAGGVITIGRKHRFARKKTKHQTVK